MRRAGQHRTIWAEEYARAVRIFDIDLGVVSKINRNRTATRTFQVPALGGFRLRERNELVAR